jgi:peptidoglycan glycosyltransferase
MNHALRRISLAVLILFLVLLANVNYVQAFEAGQLAADPGNGRTFAEQFQYQRGPIITADGKVIAASRHVGGIYAYQRYYPDGPVYAPVTGYDTLYSRSGIEAAENRYLAGTAPQLAVHNLIDEITGKPKKGATVQLTINSAAQQAAYAALKATGLPSGAVALDPATGAILALASYPSYNPDKLAVLNGNQLQRNDERLLRDPRQPLLNRAINQTYPPGSTFKVVTASAAFATGRYSPQTRFYAPTNLKLPGTTKQLINYDNLPCNNGSNPTGNGKVPLIYAFAVSCNTVYGGLGMKLGGARLRQQADRFGMNRPLAIPLPVSPSEYPPVSNPDYTAYSAIGQYSDTVTPLQEAMFAAAIANHGTLMRPYLVQKVTAPNLTPLVTAQPSVLSQAVSPTVAAEVKSMMVQVTQQPYGTAYQTAGPPQTHIVIAAKTGTAQNGINNTGLDDAVFTAFAPASNPQIAVGVVVKGGGLGADASAPVAVKIIEAYLNFLASQAKR